MDHIKVCMLVVVMLLVGVTSSAHQESAEEQLTASQKRKGSDASVDRSILVPTAETISAGDFTFNSYELFFAGLSYGVSDRLQVSVATLLPIFESFPFTLYGSLKSQLVSTERCVFSVQFGGLVFHQQGDTEGLVNLSGMLDLLLDKDGTFVLTLAEQNFFFFDNHSDSGISFQDGMGAALSASLSIRLGENIKLITEVVVPIEVGSWGYNSQEDNVVIGEGAVFNYGVRIFTATGSVDLSFIRPLANNLDPDDYWVLGIPFISFSSRF